MPRDKNFDIPQHNYPPAPRKERNFEDPEEILKKQNGISDFFRAGSFGGSLPRVEGSSVRPVNIVDIEYRAIEREIIDDALKRIANGEDSPALKF